MFECELESKNDDLIIRDFLQDFVYKIRHAPENSIMHNVQFWNDDPNNIHLIFAMERLQLQPTFCCVCGNYVQCQTKLSFLNKIMCRNEDHLIRTFKNDVIASLTRTLKLLQFTQQTFDDALSLRRISSSLLLSIESMNKK